MFRTILGAKQVNSGKNGEKHKRKQTMACHVFGLIEENMELSNVHLSVLFDVHPSEAFL